MAQEREEQMVEVRVGNVVVRSGHPESTEEAAKSVANVLSKNWLADAPEDRPLVITMTHSSGAVVTYEAELIPVH